MEKQEFIITGMTCAACEASITRTVSRLTGVFSVNVNLLSGTMIAEFDEQKIKDYEIVSAVEKIGYGAKIKGKNKGKTTLRDEWKSIQETKKKELKQMKVRVFSSFVLLVFLLYVSMGSMIGLPMPAFFSGAENSIIFALYQLCLTVVIIFINKKFFISGSKALLKRSPNMDSLVMLGSGAAFIYSLVLTFLMASAAGHGNIEGAHHFAHSLYYESSATILTLVSLGKFFEALSKQKTSRALDKLTSLSPKSATVIRNGEEITIPVEEIKVNDEIVIRAGDTLPADGEIIKGDGYLDQSAITGESMPVFKKEGETVISASICKDGMFVFRASKVGEDSTLSEIIKLVEQAGASKAPISRIADKVSGIFVPVVMTISLLSFIVWLCVGKGFGFALQALISVLVISCPCALGLATPVAIMVAMGKSASLGVLIKSAEALETLCKAKVVVFDKTGTITSGSPEVTDVLPIDGKSREDILAELAFLESGSTHPLALAIKRSVAETTILKKISEFKTEPGGGVLAKVDGQIWKAGNLNFALKEISKNSKVYKEVCESIKQFQSQGKTTVVFVKDKSVQGVVAIADKIRDTSVQAVFDLKEMKIKTVMLSGDGKLVAENVAREVGIDEVYAEVMPSGKEKTIRDLKQRDGITIMVGDGINDSPALSSADVGVAVSSGSDIAIESASVILTGNSVAGLPLSIKLSKRTMANIKMNLFWAFFYNALGIPIAAGILYPFTGILLSPMIAALAMSLSSVCVVLNALTLNLFKFKKNAKSNNNTEKVIKKEENIMKKEISISGMMCGHCVSHVTDALVKISGVEKADVSLEEKNAIVEGKNVSNEILTKAIEDAGYEVLSIKNI